jgi:hypothetical protein
MVRATLVPMLVVSLLLATSLCAAQQLPSIFHDPKLNWDFINKTGDNPTDFDVIVENGNYNPNGNDPAEVFKGIWQNFAVAHADYDGDGLNETKLTWSNPIHQIQADEIVHMGLGMKGSGMVVQGYWTKNGQPIPVVPGGPTYLPISYELTEIRPANSGEIHMQLKMPKSYFDERPSEQAGWEGIRVFRNIPADRLDLSDLTRSLNLTTDPRLAGLEVTPMYGQPGIPGSTGDPITGPVMMNIDSFFDVYLDTVGEEYLNPGYESLLYGLVLNQGEPVGAFWNLNVQCPEPGTMLLLAAGAGLTVLRRRRAKG